VAFQSLVNAENMGFIIPVPIIKHFLKDIELHGKYTVLAPNDAASVLLHCIPLFPGPNVCTCDQGFGAMGIQCQPMDNPQLRHFHKMARDIVQFSGTHHT
jgi:hypothetical protein